MLGFLDTVKLVLKLWDLIQNVIGIYKKKDADKWDELIQKDMLNYQNLMLAKTPEEKKAAEKEVAKDWFRK